MKANAAMNFQGMRAHWSYATCGGKDSWSSSHSDQYCVTQKTAAACKQVEKCAWSGTECLSEDIARMCKVDAKALKASSEVLNAAFWLIPMAVLNAACWFSA